jgi:type IV pilus assembly protein PilA
VTPTPEAPKKKLGTGLLVLIIAGGALGFCCCLGGLVALAVPNFMRFQQRAKQAECKSQLRSIYTSQRAHFAEKDRFTENADDLDFRPPVPARYAYVFSVAAAETAQGQWVTPPGVTGHCPDCNFTAGCVGNLDDDPELDTWSISSMERTSPLGARIPAGIPFNDYNDVTDRPGN